MSEKFVIFVVVTSFTMACIASFEMGRGVGHQAGVKVGAKQALSTNPVSDELEMVCLGLWVGEQDKIYIEREKNGQAR
jgi:hypothetical protein